MSIKKIKHEGFTLIELIVVIAIMLILVSVSAELLRQQFQFFNLGREVLDADWQGRIALSRLTRDIRNTQNVATAKSDEISFYDEQNDLVTYKAINNQLMLYTNGVAQGALADNTASLNLRYFDDDGSELTAPVTNLQDIRYVTIIINIVDNNTNINSTTAVFLWNTKNY